MDNRYYYVSVVNVREDKRKNRRNKKKKVHKLLNVQQWSSPFVRTRQLFLNLLSYRLNWIVRFVDEFLISARKIDIEELLLKHIGEGSIQGIRQGLWLASSQTDIRRTDIGFGEGRQIFWIRSSTGSRPEYPFTNNKVYL